jgi:hypothetical protein
MAPFMAAPPASRPAVRARNKGCPPFTRRISPVFHFRASAKLLASIKLFGASSRLRKSVFREPDNA